MLSFSLDEPRALIEITLDGAIHGPDYEAVVGAIDDLLKRHDKLNLVCVLKSFGAVDLSIWPKDLVFHATHRNWMKHVAIVSDAGWVEPVMRVFAPLYSAEICCFPFARLDEARAWVLTGNVARAAA